MPKSWSVKESVVTLAFGSLIVIVANSSGVILAWSRSVLALSFCMPANTLKTMIAIATQKSVIPVAFIPPPPRQRSPRSATNAARISLALTSNCPSSSRMRAVHL
ncbi:MAG: hypothetical protein USCAAHI_00037 [Beijerinckiaceae bacterium]|nr:MAG: hypothetical protein USCAAHI_00037 [Beijerinckiaceae bacterium]